MLLRSITKHVKDQNWFAVALDFVIVVAGVGFAMYGQQWLSDRQQRADMAIAENALQTDLVLNYLTAKEQLAVAGCRKDAYQAIAAQLLEPGDAWTPMPRPVSDDEVIEQILSPVLRSPHRIWGSRTWDAELARGTFAQMAPERRDTLDLLFKQTRHAEELQRAIYALEGRLKLLAVTTTISQSERRRYYEILGELDDKSATADLISQQTIRFIEAVGLFTIPEALSVEAGDLGEFLKQYHERGQSIYGTCYTPFEMPLLDAFIEETK